MYLPQSDTFPDVLRVFTTIIVGADQVNLENSISYSSPVL